MNKNRDNLIKRFNVDVDRIINEIYDVYYRIENEHYIYFSEPPTFERIRNMDDREVLYFQQLLQRASCFIGEGEPFNRARSIFYYTAILGLYNYGNGFSYE